MPHHLRNVRKKPTRRELGMLMVGIIATLAVFGVLKLIHDSVTPLGVESVTIDSPWIPSTVKHWQPEIDDMAKKYDIDPDMLAIIMTLESGGDPKANSGEAQGLMQITPATAKDIAARYLKQPVTKYNLYDPDTSIEFGAAYLATLRDNFGDTSQGPSWDATAELIAAGYNGGPGAANSVYEGEGLEDTQTVVYSRDAFNMWRERHASKSPTYERWLERGGSTLIADAKADQ